MIQLTEDQKKMVRQWVAEGAALSDIQKKITGEFKLAATFMDVRFLVLDLGLNIKDKKSSSPTVDLSKPAPAAESANGALEDQSSPGSVSVELDRVVKAGAVASGRVRFSDGEAAAWSLDQMGRLALSSGKAGYRPSQDDVQAFQQELARLLQNRGF